jgi:uncharacterized membrane protein
VQSFLDVLGLAGVLSMLVAYYMLQKGRVSPHSALYLWMNFAGGMAVLFSLLNNWNLSAFVMELAWVLISGYSLLIRKRKNLP